MIRNAKAMIAALTATTALAAALATGASAAETDASDLFEGCTTQHWEAYGDAVENMDGDALMILVREIETCEPLRNTARVLLCEIDPVACLPLVEPAAGDPQERPAFFGVPEGPYAIVDPYGPQGPNDGGNTNPTNHGDVGPPSSSGNDRPGIDTGGDTFQQGSFTIQQ